MSGSDAAPLPRLGEVFFDVRGSSRSMRLSWYADTGVAVFSIWQGGICTGTFRLPITDLSRMIDILQRGPHGHDEGDSGERGRAGYGEPDYATEYADDAPHGKAGYGEPAYGDPGYRETGYGDPGYEREGYGHRHADYDDREHRDREHREYGADYGRRDYADDPGYGQGQHGDYGGYQPDVTGQRSVPTGEIGYGQQRFVPPYVRDERGSSQDDYLTDSEYRQAADPGAAARHSAGRHSSGHEQ